jgi:DNA helicase-2/ATP-dependent DNA helicase PcrA
MEQTAMPRFSDPLADSLDDPGSWDDTPPELNPHPDPAAAIAALAATLTKAQAEAAAQAGPILVLAGAGTGKTSTLTAAVVQRIAADRFSPSRILAVTFTNKAAKEMAVRIRASLGGIEAPSWLGTYHGLAARQLRDQPEIAGLRPGFDILDADDSRRLLKRTMKALNLAGGGDETETGRDPLKIMANRISKFKDNLVTPQGATAWIELQDRRRRTHRRTARRSWSSRQCAGLCRLSTSFA